MEYQDHFDLNREHDTKEKERMKNTGNATAMGSTPSRQKSSNFLGDASIYQDHTQTQISLNLE